MENTTEKTKIVKIKEGAHKKAKVNAAKKGKTLQEYVSELIEKDTSKGN